MKREEEYSIISQHKEEEPRWEHSRQRGKWSIGRQEKNRIDGEEEDWTIFQKKW